MNRYEKQKKAVEKAIRGEIDEYKAIYKHAEDEDRDPTDEERLDIESHLKAIETLKVEKEDCEANIKTLEHVDDIGRQLGPVISVGMEPHDRFIEEANQRRVPPQAQKSDRDRRSSTQTGTSRSSGSTATRDGSGQT